MKDGKYKGAHWETRRAILGKLKRRGALASSVMAQELGVSSMAVRQHLQELEESGDVCSRNVPQGKGRPTKFWELTQASNRHFPDRHRDLALDLIASISEALGPEGMERLLDTREKQQVAAYRERVGEASELKERVQALAAIRSEEGYMAEVEAGEEGAFYLVENHCPVCDAARTCTGLCATELSVFRQTLGDGVDVDRTEHLMDGARRCAYRVAARK